MVTKEEQKRKEVHARLQKVLEILNNISKEDFDEIATIEQLSLDPEVAYDHMAAAYDSLLELNQLVTDYII